MALADVLAALYTANGIQAALLHRERTGEALHVEVPLMEAALAGLVNVGAGTLMTGKPPEGWATPTPRSSPTRPSPAATGRRPSAWAATASSRSWPCGPASTWTLESGWRPTGAGCWTGTGWCRSWSGISGGRTVAETIAFCDANAIPASQVRTVDDVLFRQAGQPPPPDPDPLRRTGGRMIPVLASPVLFNDERACCRCRRPGGPE